VIHAVQRKATFWRRLRHSFFKSRPHQLLNRVLVAEPEGFTDGMALHKAISPTMVIGEVRSPAYPIRWPAPFSIRS
jgi:hypothetical protein